MVCFQKEAILRTFPQELVGELFCARVPYEQVALKE